MNDRSTARPLTWPASVLLITAPDCHLCLEGKAVLERLGREYPLRVSDVALASAQGRALAAAYGILFPPGLLLDGVLVGFGRVSERKLRRLLEQRRRLTLIAQGIGG